MQTTCGTQLARVSSQGLHHRSGFDRTSTLSSSPTFHRSKPWRPQMHLRAFSVSCRAGCSTFQVAVNYWLIHLFLLLTVRTFWVAGKWEEVEILLEWMSTSNSPCRRKYSFLFPLLSKLHHEPRLWHRALTAASCLLVSTAVTSTTAPCWRGWSGWSKRLRYSHWSVIDSSNLSFSIIKLTCEQNTNIVGGRNFKLKILRIPVFMESQCSRYSLFIIHLPNEVVSTGY